MEILSVIARLLDYPKQDVKQHKSELAEVICASVEIPPQHREQLLTLLADIYDGELMDAEERYTGLFEQGRSLSLHVFEHVHGESRDRGQAMVDLMAEYESHGFEIDSRELPDYIPLFLEYLSYQPDLDAREWLANVSHILALLGARLKERQSPYAYLFESMLLIAGCRQALDDALAKISDEEPDNTMEAIDKEWEEVAVTFGTDDVACDSKNSNVSPEEPQPMRWVDAAQPLSKRRAQGGPA